MLGGRASASRASSIRRRGVARRLQPPAAAPASPLRDLLAERLGLPVVVDNDANAAMLAEWRCGAARGARERDHADARHRHRRRARRRRRARARRARRGRRARPHRRRRRRAAVPGAAARTTAAWRRWRPGHALGARGPARRRARRPDSGARARARRPGARSPARSSPSWPTTATRRRATRSTLIGRGASALGHRRRWSTSSTPRSWSSAAARSPPASCCSSRRARSSRARALPIDARATCAIVPARFGAESGMLGAALHGARRLAGVADRMSGRLDRLPDADRQPRGRHAARALGAARGRRHRLRGHAHDARCCSTATGCRPSACATTRTTSGAWRRELVERMRAGAVVALVSDAGHAARQRSRARARPGVRGRGARGRGAARAQRGAGRARRESGCAADDLALRRASCRASEGRVGGGPALARDASWRSSRRGGSASSLAVLARSTRRGRSPSAAS